LYTGFRDQLSAAGSGGELARRVETLDPTQHVVYTTIAEWDTSRLAWHQAGARTAPPTLRLLLLGTAGTGKTHTAQIAVAHVRRALGSFRSVLTVAFSGVAAANLGGGARTVDSIFHTNSDDAAEDLRGEGLDKLVEELREVELLVLDEVSTIGAASFQIICRRLEQVGKVLWRVRYRTRPPDDIGWFGGIGVLLMGDFAQLPPVLASSLLSGATIMEGKKSGLRAFALAGRQTFEQFQDVIRLRRIHRILGAGPFKESTMRLRDAAITVEDYNLWKTHEIESLEPSCTELWPEAAGLLSEALVLVTDNAQAGRINGGRLVSGVPLYSEPSPASSQQVVVRCEARHNNPRGERPKADEFRNIRKALHLRIGARVILIANAIWGVNTVPLGLMNGARGVVVAILYAAANAERLDGCQLASTGYPSSDGGRFPRGLDRCPLPEFVVIHFPDYKGPCLLPGLPATWVPVPCAEVRGQTRKKLCRCGLPLRLAWALTIHKSQGITAHEGTVISFAGSRMPRAVAKLGLAFVAWTRVTKWSKIAFQSLPPLEEFLAVRLTKEFQLREAFETLADDLHDAFMQTHGITQEMQIDAHRKQLQQHLMTTEARVASEVELQDIEIMLSQRGVKPVSDSVNAWGEKQTAKRGGGGLWTIVASFRADRRAKDAGDKVISSSSKRPNKNKQPDIGIAFKSTTALLKEHGYPDGHIAEALEKCGPHLARCVEYCLSKESAVETLGEDFSLAPVGEEEWAQELIQSLGFDVQTTTEALEACEFSFSHAVLFLLHGNDADKTKVMGAHHFRRHTLKKTHSLGWRVTAKTANDHVRGEYSLRAQGHFHRDMHVVDFGQYAGGTTNACFWLCLAAGLGLSSWRLEAQALPGLADTGDLLHEVRTLPLAFFDKGVGVRTSPLGLFAERLRKYMCAGPDAVLLRRDMLEKLFPAFAAIGTNSERRQLRHYREWVERLADREFADELVILAVTLEFNVRIVCIPHTRPDAPRPWAISTYAPPTAPLGNEIVLGNNDVHYMWLKDP